MQFFGQVLLLYAVLKAKYYERCFLKFVYTVKLRISAHILNVVAVGYTLCVASINELIH